jgi:hypothetical protein
LFPRDEWIVCSVWAIAEKVRFEDSRKSFLGLSFWGRGSVDIRWVKDLKYARPLATFHSLETDIL